MRFLEIGDYPNSWRDECHQCLSHLQVIADSNCLLSHIAIYRRFDFSVAKVEFSLLDSCFIGLDANQQGQAGLQEQASSSWPVTDHATVEGCALGVPPMPPAPFDFELVLLACELWQPSTRENATNDAAMAKVLGSMMWFLSEDEAAL